MVNGVNMPNIYCAQSFVPKCASRLETTAAFEIRCPVSDYYHYQSFHLTLITGSHKVVCKYVCTG